MIEREDHALSISVQYEKHPMFCAHCKILGHIIQNCSKLNTNSKPVGSVMMKSHNAHVMVRSHNVNDKTIPIAGLNGKKGVNGSSSINLS